MSKKQKSKTLYAHPFSKAYWRDACAELRDVRMLVTAALLIALRVAMKGIFIPLAPNLHINLGYFVNALGAMIFGPVVAALAAAVSDTLGCIYFPKGPYFFPFIFIEIAGSVIFALFLYRSKVSAWRLILSRFSVIFFVNILLNMPIMALFYKFVMHKSYVWLQLPTIAKNLSLFPLEALLLILFMSVMLPICYQLGLVYFSGEGLKVTKKVAIGLVSLSLVAAVTTGSYLVYNYNTSNQASWLDPAEKKTLNTGLTREAVEQGLMEEDQICIVRRVFKKLGRDQAEIVFDVYDVAEGADLDTIMTFRSKDAKEHKKESKHLTKRYEGHATVDKKELGQPLTISVSPDE